MHQGTIGVILKFNCFGFLLIKWVLIYCFFFQYYYSVELFHRTCDEASDWMNEKMTQLDTAELGPDLKTVQALQRRHKNLERELAPVEEKVNRVNLLANS